MESELVLLQLSESFPVCWKYYEIFTAENAFCSLLTLIRLHRALSISPVILQYCNKFWGWTASFLTMDCVCVCGERETNMKGRYDLSQEVPCLLERVAWLSGPTEVVWTLKNQLQGPLSSCCGSKKKMLSFFFIMFVLRSSRNVLSMQRWHW